MYKKIAAVSFVVSVFFSLGPIVACGHDPDNDLAEVGFEQGVAYYKGLTPNTLVLPSLYSDSGSKSLLCLACVIDDQGWVENLLTQGQSVDEETLRYCAINRQVGMLRVIGQNAPAVHSASDDEPVPSQAVKNIFGNAGGDSSSLGDNERCRKLLIALDGGNPDDSAIVQRRPVTKTKTGSGACVIS